MAGVLRRKRQGDLRQRHTERRRPKEDRGRDWSEAAIDKKGLGPPEVGREKERISAGPSGGSEALLTCGL